MFGYKCQECGNGIVQDTIIRNYQTKIQGLPFIVKDAIIGICDQCGAKHFDYKETLRWEEQLKGGMPPSNRR